MDWCFLQHQNSQCQMAILGKHLKKVQEKRTWNKTWLCSLYLHGNDCLCSSSNKQSIYVQCTSEKHVFFSIAHTPNVGLICFLRSHPEIEPMYCAWANVCISLILQSCVSKKKILYPPLIHIIAWFYLLWGNFGEFLSIFPFCFKVKFIILVRKCFHLQEILKKQKWKVYQI